MKIGLIHTMRPFFLAMLMVLASSPAWAETYHLDIARETVNFTGHPVKKITINGGIPGPTLRFTQGEEAIITVTNHLDEDSSVHWHGLLLPGEMDGVPGFNGFPGIRPGETFTYRFPLRQAGTYWYHAHSLAQEQEGHYGSIVIKPKDADRIKADRDYVVLLSDFTDEDALEILDNLKLDAGYYNYHKRTVGDFFADVGKKGFGAAWQDYKAWGEMRMSPTDLADVSGYTFLTNGKTAAQNWTGIFKAGEKVRLRFINASAMTFYDVRIPGLKMKVVAADGQDVEPVTVDEFRFGIAETYDVIVQPEENKAYTIAAESIDRTGFAMGTLAPQEGMRGEIPTKRSRTLLTMADMGMAHSGHAPAKMDHASMEGMDHGAMGGRMAEMKSGWADAGTPPGSRALTYKDLRYNGIQPKTEAPEREVELLLGGSMERFIWTINGKKFEHSGPIHLDYGERVRLKFTNETMMPHPMHLHGMFVQLENGQPAEKLPNKHTVIVPPGQSLSVLLTADEAGDWAFHCHLLYHMLGGMMTSVHVAKPGEQAPKPTPADASEGDQTHAH